MGFSVSDCDDDHLESLLFRSYIADDVKVAALEEIKRRTRLEGWVPMGTHVDCTLPLDRRIEFSDERDECGLPEWERIVTVEVDQVPVEAGCFCWMGDGQCEIHVAVRR